jgi:hypothetical protein
MNHGQKMETLRLALRARGCSYYRMLSELALVKEHRFRDALLGEIVAAGTEEASTQAKNASTTAPR